MIYHLLLRTHVVEGGQVDHVSDLETVDEWFYKPASRDAPTQLEWSDLCTILLVSGEGKYLCLLARCIFLVYYSEFGMAYVAEGVLVLIAYIVIKIFSHLRRVVDLILEYFEHV